MACASSAVNTRPETMSSIPREAPTRRGVSFVDPAGDRAITVIGQRLQPCASDPLPWRHLADCDGVFVTATDAIALGLCRAAKVLTVTPRLRLAAMP